MVIQMCNYLRDCDHLGKIGTAVSQHHDLAIDAHGFTPGLHDKGVIDRHTRDGVDALALELVCLLDEAGQVLGAASWREGAWHCENDDLQPRRIIFLLLLKRVGAWCCKLA